MDRQVCHCNRRHKTFWGESSWMQTHHGGSESSAHGRWSVYWSVHGAKRTVGETSRNRGEQYTVLVCNWKTMKKLTPRARSRWDPYQLTNVEELRVGQHRKTRSGEHCSNDPPFIWPSASWKDTAGHHVEDTHHGMNDHKLKHSFVCVDDYTSSQPKSTLQRPQTSESSHTGSQKLSKTPSAIEQLHSPSVWPYHPREAVSRTSWWRRRSPPTARRQLPLYHCHLSPQFAAAHHCCSFDKFLILLYLLLICTYTLYKLVVRVLLFVVLSPRHVL